MHIPILALLVLLLAGCSGAPMGALPTAPTSTATSAQEDAAYDVPLLQEGEPATGGVLGTGSLRLQCSLFTGCSYRGQIVNQSGDCVSRIKGRVTLLDQARQPVASDWFYFDRERRLKDGKRAAYEGCCLSLSGWRRAAFYAVKVYYRPRCG